ncbi:hypothetical protein DM02DRAFT_664223 [Periconia macrospinosa]|uniref:Rhodopsin domain-containing protein n=1 Tax=Periconia macrospinosa TaxID=97972 RepID=A0A2V1CZN1_9PLEO|nr:hypothetical protein DM02DRAFT_664223 [Periconia macrospinosa]
MIIDFIILILPLPILWELHLSVWKKILVLGVFICGYLVIATSTGRLVATIQLGDALREDLTWNTAMICNWLLTEGPISILSICLPSIFAFFKRGYVKSLRSLISIDSNESGQRLHSLRVNSQGNQLFVLRDSSSCQTNNFRDFDEDHRIEVTSDLEFQFESIRYDDSNSGSEIQH